MINRRIAISTLSILSALLVTGTATFAAFTSQATSTGNTFTSGNADLQIAVDNSGTAGTFGATLADAFNVSGITPGYDQSHFFWLKNNSASNIDLSTLADVSAYTANTSQDIALSNSLLVSWRCDLNNNNSLSDEAYTPEFSVKAWFDGGNATIGTIPHLDEMFCEMRTRLPSDADSTVADGAVDFNVAYDATQTP